MQKIAPQAKSKKYFQMWFFPRFGGKKWRRSEPAHASYPGLFFRPPGFSPYWGRAERRVQGLDYKNPRSMYARVPLAMGQFVLKIEKLSHIMGTTPILEMARAYGLCSGIDVKSSEEDTKENTKHLSAP